MGCLVVVGAGVLTNVDTQIQTPVGADGVGRGSFPVAEITGLGSTGANFQKLTAALQAGGQTVLDFDASKAGVQPLTYRPTSSAEHIPDLAVDVVQPEIEAALKRAGYQPRHQPVDVVAHSMGGLAVRFLIEQPGTGVEADWARRIDDLIMVATPNHGSAVVGFETSFGPFSGLGSDMKPGSAFLRRMGTTEPAGEVYTAIGGDPWEFRWVRYGHHGFDDTVPTESPFMTGAATDTFPYFHGQLLREPSVIALITATLAAS